MTATALGLALGAAFLHASWNVLLARARDVHAATAVVLAVSIAIVAPAALFTWEVDAVVWPWALGSAVCELAYFALLAFAYERAELSVVYPVARGLAPVVVLVAGISSATAGEALGVVFVAVGVLLVRGLRHADSRGVLLGAAIASFIAGYTVLDDRGIELADPVSYYLFVVGFPGLVYIAFVWRLRGGAALRAEFGPATICAGVAATVTYVFILIALDLAAAAPVAAVRETSVVIAVALAAIFLGERVGAPRAAGAAVVAAGVALLSF